MKKLLGLCAILVFTQPLFAQAKFAVGHAIGSAVSQTEKIGADAMLHASEVEAKAAVQTSQVMAHTSLQTSPVLTNIKLRIPTARTARTLQERVERTYRKALEVQQKYPDLFIYGPMEDIGPANKATSDRGMSLHLRAKSSYPNAPFLAYSPQNLTNYFLAQENRHIIRLTPQLNALQEEWRANINNFKKSQIQWEGPKEQEMHWLAGQIPLNTSYLLLGEVHNNPRIHTKISQLLQELRLQQPEREIILLTELWPKSKLFRKIESLHEKYGIFEEYAPIVWQTAKENGIDVVGLELAAARLPQELKPKINSNYQHHLIEKNPTEGISMWSSLEGIRLRNDSWLASIQQLRQKHPDALFVVYAGNYHIRGWNPFSLSTALKEENTFTVSFIRESKVTWFDEVTEDEFGDPRVLSFRDKYLRELFGTDVQIRVF